MTQFLTRFDESCNVVVCATLNVRFVRQHNRLGAVLSHVPWYWFKRLSRLSKDSGVSKSTISRILRGQSRPSYRTIAKLAAAIERRSKVRLDPRELVSEDGNYPTVFVCSLMKCPGCLPPGSMAPKSKAGLWTGDIAEDLSEWEPILELK